MKLKTVTCARHGSLLRYFGTLGNNCFDYHSLFQEFFTSWFPLHPYYTIVQWQLD